MSGVVATMVPRAIALPHTHKLLGIEDETAFGLTFVLSPTHEHLRWAA
jgi:hypothetical protein